jgi:hypothetical protein
MAARALMSWWQARRPRRCLRASRVMGEPSGCLNNAPCPPCASHGASINRTPESFPALAAPLSRLSAGCSRCAQLTTILTHLLPPIGLSSRPQVTTVGERTGSSAVTSKHRRLKLNCPLLSACWVILCYRIFTICVGSVLVSLYVA